MAIEICKLGVEFTWGAIIEGVDWSNLANKYLRAELRHVLEDRGFIVFRGMEPSAEMQVELSKVFGPLKDHPTNSTDRSDDVGHAALGVIDIYAPSQSDHANEGVVLIDGKRTAGYSPWHFDHCYNNELNRAGVLRCLIRTPVAGRTGFCDGIELYHRISPDLRAKIEGLNVLITVTVH